MFCDWQLFWHKHRERPRLITGYDPSGGYRERMADNGEIVRDYYPAMDWSFRDAIAALRSQPSGILGMFK